MIFLRFSLSKIKLYGLRAAKIYALISSFTLFHFSFKPSVCEGFKIYLQLDRNKELYYHLFRNFWVPTIGFKKSNCAERKWMRQIYAEYTIIRPLSTFLRLLLWNHLSLFQFSSSSFLNDLNPYTCFLSFTLRILLGLARNDFFHRTSKKRRIIN